MRGRSWIRRPLRAVAAATSWATDRVRGVFSGVRYGASAFEGAVQNRLTLSDWISAPMASADREIRGDLRDLRRSARAIARNDSHGARILSLLEENVVGPHGIALQARVDIGDDAANQRINRAIEEAWWRWASTPGDCSVDGRLSLVDIKGLVLRGRKTDGEALVRMVEGYPGSGFGFALQVLDPDQLDHTFERAPRDGENEVRMGVEIDAWGRPVAYHVWKAHPWDYQHRPLAEDRERIPAHEIIHLFRTRRPGQTRGVSEFAPVMRDLRHLHGYREAELVAARMAAAKGGFFKRSAELTPDPNSLRSEEVSFPTSAEPGHLTVIPAGWDFVDYDPSHPNHAFGEFSKSVLRTICAGMGAAYASVTGDLTEVSFSSIRKGDRTEQDGYMAEQWWLVTHLLERIYPRWMLWALTSGQLDLPTARVADWLAHDWQPRGFPYVDPLKDALADELAIANGLDTRTDAAARRGRDFEDMLRTRAREERLAREIGVDVSGGKRESRVSEERAEEDPQEPGILELLLSRRKGHLNGRANGHPAP